MAAFASGSPAIAPFVSGALPVLAGGSDPTVPCDSGRSYSAAGK
jgi:hypothetical protein